MSQRSDASRNRQALLDAARRLFAQNGAEVSLAAIADAAGVSRTTLYRNFSTRQDLAATVFDENVSLIEQRAEELSGRPNAARVLLDFVFDMQLRNRSIGAVLADDHDLLVMLGERTAAAFEPLVAQSRSQGLLHDGVTTRDFLLALQMAEAGLHDREQFGAVSALLRRGLLRHA